MSGDKASTKSEPTRVKNDQTNKRSFYKRGLLLVNVIGLLLSLYSYHVQLSRQKDADYKALCDISERMSCTKVLDSPFAKGFGVVEKVTGKSSIFNQNNSILGIIHYTLLFFLSFSNNKYVEKIILILSVLSNISSIYLAAILVILNNICIVCVLTYVVNALNLLFIYQKSKISDDNTKTKKKVS